MYLSAASGPSRVHVLDVPDDFVEFHVQGTAQLCLPSKSTSRLSFVMTVSHVATSQHGFVALFRVFHIVTPRMLKRSIPCTDDVPCLRDAIEEEDEEGLRALKLALPSALDGSSSLSYDDPTNTTDQCWHLSHTIEKNSSTSIGRSFIPHRRVLIFGLEGSGAGLVANAAANRKDSILIPWMKSRAASPTPRTLHLSRKVTDVILRVAFTPVV